MLQKVFFSYLPPCIGNILFFAESIYNIMIYHFTLQFQRFTKKGQTICYGLPSFCKFIIHPSCEILPAHHHLHPEDPEYG